MYKAFVKSKDEAEKEKKKVNFSINSYIESIESVEGLQRESTGEMMWEGAHEEFCKSAKVGASILGVSSQSYTVHFVRFIGLRGDLCQKLT